MNRMNDHPRSLLDSSIELEHSIRQQWLSQSRFISLSLLILEQAPGTPTETLLPMLNGLSVNLRLLLTFRSEVMLDSDRTWAIRWSRSSHPPWSKLRLLEQAITQTNTAMQLCTLGMLSLLTALVRTENGQVDATAKEPLWELYGSLLKQCEDMLHNVFNSVLWFTALNREGPAGNNPLGDRTGREANPIYPNGLLNALRTLDGSVTRLRYSTRLPSVGLTRMLTQVRQLGERLQLPSHLVKQQVSTDPAAPWYNLQLGKRKRRKR